MLKNGCSVINKVVLPMMNCLQDLQLLCVVAMHTNKIAGRNGLRIVFKVTLRYKTVLYLIF